jgi:hypothetical protein
MGVTFILTFVFKSTLMNKLLIHYCVDNVQFIHIVTAV